MKRQLQIVLLLVLLSSSCSSSGQEEGRQSSATPSSAAPEVTIAPDFSDPVRPDTTPTTAQGATVDLSPIEVALGAITDPEELAGEFENVRIAAADFISACLAEAGFAGWVEPVATPPTAAQLAASERSQIGSLVQGGYGAAITLRGTWQTISDPGQATPDDANPVDEYLANLPEDQHQPFLLEQGSCRALAMERHPDPISIPAQIAQEISEVRSNALEAREVQEATLNWSECMQGQGYAVASRSDAVEMVWAERSSVDSFLFEFLGSEMIPTEDDMQTFEDLIAPVEDLEAAVVTADLSCAEETGEFEVRRTAMWEAEEAWLMSNEDRVALLLAEK